MENVMFEPAIFQNKIMHKRFFPKENAFVYSSYAISMPLSKRGALNKGRLFGVNRPGLLSFYESDHGAHNGQPLDDWVRTYLKTYGFQDISEIILITQPRVLGYVFNPVSFFLCFDKNQALRAVLFEVHNTFGETHSYLCFHTDRRPIENDDVLEADKVFHVSPFMKREGRYTFRVARTDGTLGVWIDFYNEEGKKQLITSISGKFTTFKTRTLLKTLFLYPHVTLRTIALIHWQALKLVLKGIRYVPKPKQKDERLTASAQTKE